MAYSNYKRLRTVIQEFELEAISTNLFTPKPSPKTPSPWLKTSLEKAKAQPLLNEKAKSERLLSPILMEVAETFQDHVTLFSGEPLDLDPDRGLIGVCDFLFALAPNKPYLEAPVISIVEAKNDDLEYGKAQCAVQLYAAHVFNQQEGKSISVLYGCATDGREWQFLRFQNGVFEIDRESYTQVEEVLGIWYHILDSYT